MRNTNVMKKGVTFVVLILSLNVVTVSAQAGFFDNIKKSMSQLFKKKKSSENDNKTSVVETVNVGVTKTANAKHNVNTVDTTNSASPLFLPERDLIERIISNAIPATGRLNTAGARSEKADSVATETHTEIIPEFSEQGLTFVFRYDEAALKEPSMLLTDLLMVAALTKSLSRSLIFSDSAGSIQPFSIAELLVNMKEGSLTAKARWLALQARLLKKASLSGDVAQNMGVKGNIFNDLQVNILERSRKADAEAANFSRQQQKKIDQWKSETGIFDKLEAMQEKLNHLIIKNDRKGVRKLVETYLPWAVMEPVEVNTWKIWLDAIENPDPTNTTIAFRGVDYKTDKVQRATTENGEIFGFMSTVLTKNQGSYTRRLRSLATNREKNGDMGFNPDEGFNVKTVMIAEQMLAHAKEPKASSFISFSYDPILAKSFIGDDKQKKISEKTVSIPNGGLLVVNVDSRRMIPNLTSNFKWEVEILVPLIIFPDEVVSYHEGIFKSNAEFDEFMEDISQKTGINFSKWDSAKTENNETLKVKYKREGFSFMRKIMHINTSAMACSDVFE